MTTNPGLPYILGATGRQGRSDEGRRMGGNKGMERGSNDAREREYRKGGRVEKGNE